jgi:outer membrane protein assembly factor BamB
MKNTILFCICYVFGFFTVSAQTPENWARFRGPNGQGVSTATGFPVRWSAEENIAWKADIPGEGWSSPIVWNNHIFLTTATEDGKNCHIIAVDRNTGKILWDKVVFTQKPRQHRHEMNSYATPTPVTDGKTVFAVFSGGGFAALDFDGNVRWLNTDLDFYSHHGMGTSPILYGDLLLLAVNHSNREEPRALGWTEPWDKSYLLALDRNTGKERWRGMRGMSRIGHSTPVVMPVNGKDQIISVAGNVIQGFNPADGKLIWTVASDGEPCVPSPAIGDGLVYSAPTNRAPIRAVRPDGQGDCTATHITWEQSGNTPTMSSFLYVKPCLYTCTDNRNLACLDAATGTLLWKLPLRSGALNPSPVYADGKIYVLSEQGTTTVLKPAADPKQPAELIATNELNEHCRASIAVAGKQLIIRTDNRLWCIGN